MDGKRNRVGEAKRANPWVDWSEKGGGTGPGTGGTGSGLRKEDLTLRLDSNPCPGRPCPMLGCSDVHCRSKKPYLGPCHITQGKGK